MRIQYACVCINTSCNVLLTRSLDCDCCDPLMNVFPHDDLGKQKTSRNTVTHNKSNYECV